MGNYRYDADKPRHTNQPHRVRHLSILFNQTISPLIKHKINYILIACLGLFHSEIVYSKQEQTRLSISSGGFISSGDYRSNTTEDDVMITTGTDIWAIPISLKYKKDNWSAALSSVYLRIKGSRNIFFFDEVYFEEEDEEVLFIDTHKEEHVREGLGDSLLTLNHKPDWRPSRNSQINWGIKIKLPTSSSEKRLGSGKIDMSAFTGLNIRFQQIVLNSLLGYQKMGDTDQTNYNNRWFTSIGGLYLLNSHFVIGASYRYKQASRDEKAAVEKTSAHLSWQPNRSWRYTLYNSIGLSHTSADYSTGFQVTYEF